MFKSNFYRILRTGLVYLCGAFILPVTATAATVMNHDTTTDTCTVKSSKSTVRDVLRYIEEHSNYVFVYAEGTHKALGKSIEIDLTGKKMEVVIADVCAKAGLDYRIMGRQVTIFPKGKAPKDSAPKKNIRGIVYDEEGEPLIGASIRVKGSSEGVITNINGEFSILAKQGQELEASYIGFTAQTVLVDSEMIKIKLTGSINLDEVVVIGYGSAKKKDLTGGLAVIDDKTLHLSASGNLMDRLVGQVAGFSITTGDAKPGSDQSLIIRGTNSLSGSNAPLVVLDGIPYDGSMSDIDPNLVESMTILKDASSVAIYGSRGSNGVILVTSKKGSKGNAKVVYKGTFGFAEELQRIETMGPNEYIRFKQDIGRLGAKQYSGVDLDPLYGQILSASERINYARGISRDWQDDVFRTTFQMNHQISLSGGTDNSSYMAAVSYLDEPGVVVNSQYKRINVFATVQQKLGKWLNVGLTTQFVNRETGGLTPNLEHAVKQSPFGIFSDETGNYYEAPMDFTLFGHPLSNINADNKCTNRQALLNGYIELNPIKGLTIKTQFGYNYRDNFTGTYYGRNTVDGKKTDGSASISNWRNTDWTWENFARYDNNFGVHHLDVTALMSMQEKSDVGNWDGAESFVNDDMSFYSLANGEKNITVGSSYGKETMISYMGRVNYMYDSRYLITLTGRVDGASVFGANNKYGFFPSVAVAWNIANEKFISENIQWINMLKLRLSYGVNGNNAISRYQTLDRLYTNNGIKYIWGDGGSAVNSAYLANDGVGNPNLKWETTHTANVGIDFSFLNGRINGSVDMYLSRTKDLLMTRTVPIMNGYSMIWDNIGETQNKGIELTLNSINLQSRDFSWKTGLSFFLNRDKIVDLRGDKVDDLANNWFINQPMSVFYDYNVVGIWQENDKFTFTDANGNEVEHQTGAQPGSAKLEDVDGNGYIDSNDKKIIGSKRPSFTMSMSNTFNFKQIYCSFVLNGLFGRWMQDNIPNIDSYTFGVGNYIHGINYWTPENTNADVPSPGYTRTFSHEYYKKENYVQIKNVTIGYTFKPETIKKLKLKGLDVNFSIDNLAVFSNIRQILNYDNTWFASYPMQRAYRLGFTVTF